MKIFKSVIAISSLSLLSACSLNLSKTSSLVDHSSSPTFIETYSATQLAPNADQITYKVRIYELQRVMTNEERKSLHNELKNSLDNVFHLKYSDFFYAHNGLFVITGSNKPEETNRLFGFQEKIEGMIKVPVFKNVAKATTYTTAPANFRIDKIQTYTKGMTTVTTSEGSVTSVIPGEINSGVALNITPQWSDGNSVESRIIMSVRLLDELSVNKNTLVEKPSIFHASVDQKLMLPSGGTVIFIFNREEPFPLLAKEYIIAISPTVYPVNK
ncbi:hypothetical protein HLB25_10265 [Dickeya dadantii]|uniref:hypothetical protein n=1 Tax=Dickeya dadantii TaxID=204038 RepID=UPI001495A82C|nr:hypothetical protein [Dickeya dadantii]NPE55893.1 hypothetical protein [Dickeya dadantii]NPE67117.1 hypothetical protein [Dickeya dadantii]